MKNVMRFIKNSILGIIIGIFIGAASIVLADTINSNEVLYDNSNSNSSATDVQGAIDDVYNTLDKVGSGYSLIAHAPEGLSTELVAGLYRYQGVQDANNTVDNYICFGTTSKSDCTSNTDAYMYRIIGINTNGQMKLIKKETLKTAYSWNSTSTSGANWAHSELYNGLNGNYFLTNTTYVPNSSWSNRIVASDWHYGDIIDTTISTIAEMELGSTDIVSAKIGLMYIHDYAYSLQTPAYSNTSWIHLRNNDASTQNSSVTANEWTISRRNSYYTWRVQTNGFVNNYSNEGNTNSVRPVFFLSASEKITSGSGTLTDPYILS